MGERKVEPQEQSRASGFHPIEPIAADIANAGVGHFRPFAAWSATGCRAPKAVVNLVSTIEARSTETAVAPGQAAQRAFNAQQAAPKLAVCWIPFSY